MLFGRFKKKDKFEKGLVEDKLLQFYKEKKEKVNIISFLGNKRKVFNDIISIALKESKKVLYITTEVSNSIDILNKFKINILSTKLTSSHSNKVNVCTPSEALYLTDKFNLVIYDDINSYPLVSKESIGKIMKRLVSSYGLMIAYSIEPIFDNESILYCTHDKYIKTPLIEPRIITTRLKIEEDIPMVVYEYLLWAINSNSNVLIYVPSEEKGEKIYNYLLNIKEKLTEKIFLSNAPIESNSSIKKIMNKEGFILVTNNFKMDYPTLKKLNIMIFFADNYRFNYKELVYLVSKVKMDINSNRQEAIFLCNDENEHMDKAKDILRELNKRAWDEGALKL